MNIFRRCAAFAAVIAFASPTQAAILDFDVTGDETFHFQLDSSPGTSLAVPTIGFMTSVIGEPAVPAAGPANAFFLSDALGGGFSLFGLAGAPMAFLARGIQIYSGPETVPLFSPGVFDLSGVSGRGSYTLTISAPPQIPSVPEPAGWALLVAGFALTGSFMRKRRQHIAFS